MLSFNIFHQDKTVNVSHSVNPKSEPFYRSYSKIFLLEMGIFNANRINAHFKNQGRL